MTKSKIADEIAALAEERWTPDDARRVLAACAAAGQTQAAFAREHGLRQQRLSWWQSQLREREVHAAEASGSMVRFVPAVVRPAARARVDAGAVVRIPGVVMVEISEASPQWVAALVRELSEAAS
jgi:transposase-like protein